MRTANIIPCLRLYQMDDQFRILLADFTGFGMIFSLFNKEGVISLIYYPLQFVTPAYQQIIDAVKIQAIGASMNEKITCNSIGDFKVSPDCHS